MEKVRDRMPIHEYKCSQCHTKIEVLQKAKDNPLLKCKKCGGPLVKLISSPAIQFKGTGWYITDYAKKNSPAPESPPKPKPTPAAESKEPSGPTSGSTD